MDLDVYVLGQDGAAGRRRGLIIHIAPAGKVVGKAMIPPTVLSIRVVDAPEDWEKTIQIGSHREGRIGFAGAFILKSRWVLALPHGSVVSWVGLPLTDRLPVARALYALGGTVEG